MAETVSMRPGQAAKLTALNSAKKQPAQWAGTPALLHALHGSVPEPVAG